MKKKIIVTVSILIIICALLASCAELVPSNSKQTEQSTDSLDTSAQKKLEELESKLLTLLQNQQLSETERKKEIAELTAAIEKLKENATEQKPLDTNSDKTESTEKETAATESFKYTLQGGRAIINEISTLGESVTIPSVIDGYRVYAVGSDAIASSSVTSVIISDGIEKLDWFAFRGCLNLSSVTIPNSVSSIGYGAFDNTSRALTIFCSRDSFAHQYAQSYGLTYSIA